MDTLILTPEEHETYRKIKRLAKAGTDGEVLKWLIHDWKRLKDEEEQRSLEAGRQTARRLQKDPYKTIGVSTGGVLTAVDNDPDKKTTKAGRLLKRID